MCWIASLVACALSLFCHTASAWAQAAPALSGTGQEPPSLVEAIVQMLPMLAICYLIFYFMVIRPQDSKNKQQKALFESLKRGDSVITTSGMIAKISSVETDHLVLEIAPNVKVKFLRSGIARLEAESAKSKAA